MKRRNFLKALSLTAMGVTVAQSGIALANTSMEWLETKLPPPLFKPCWHEWPDEPMPHPREPKIVKNMSSSDLFVTVTTRYENNIQITTHLVKVGYVYMSGKRFTEYVNSFSGVSGEHEFIGMCYGDYVIDKCTFTNTGVGTTIIIKPRDQVAIDDSLVIKKKTDNALPSFFKKNYIATLYS